MVAYEKVVKFYDMDAVSALVAPCHFKTRAKAYKDLRCSLCACVYQDLGV